MRKGWKIERLGNISGINYGYTAKASPEDVGPKFLRITDIQNGTVNWDRVPTCPINNSDLGKHRLQTGDIVFARTGATTGKSYLILDAPEAVAASYLIRMRIQRDGVDPAFVALFFQTEDYWKAVAAGTSGSAQGGFNASKLSELKIPVPPLPEQKRIIAILDEAFMGIDAAIANTKKNLANARELFESVLNIVFSEAYSTNEVVKLSEISEEITDGDHMPPPKSASGVPFITIKNIDKTTKKIDFENTFSVPHEYFNGLKPNKRPQKGDVLYTVTGSFGIPVLINEDKEFCFQRHIGLVRPKPGIQSAWLYYLLLSPQIVAQANSKATGTAQKTVSLKALRGFEVPLVKLSRQNETAKRLDDIFLEVGRIESIYQLKLSALTELKQSLLQKAFSGELTTKDTNKATDEAVA